MRTPRALAVLVAAMLLAAGFARASGTTTCTLGGPTPGSRLIRIDLPQGSSKATIGLTASRASQPIGGRASWHLAVGYAIFDASTFQLVSWRIVSSGVSTRRIAVDDGATSAGQDMPLGPDAPFEHTSWQRVSTLDPGSYYVIGFGSDGDKATPNASWGADLAFNADVSCAPVGQSNAQTDIFDHDQTAFHGGTGASASVAGAADGSLTVTTARAYVFGLIDANTQDAGVGHSSVGYRIPAADGSGLAEGTVSDAVAPFLARGGSLVFSNVYAGAFPITLVAGVAFDL